MGAALLLAPDFLLIAAGAALKRTQLLDATFWPGLERLVYFILFPALLFRSLARSPLAFGDAGRMIAIAYAFTIAGMLLSALARPVLRLPQPTFAACFQCGFRFNTYVAIAAASRIAGDAGVALISLLIGTLVPLVNVAAVGMLARGRDHHILRELARNPLILASLAGFAWQAAGAPLPDVVDHVLRLLGGAALPLGLLAVGAGLVLKRGTLGMAAIAWWNGIKLVAMPAIALAAAYLLNLTPLERQIAVVMAAAPTAPSAYILAMQMTGHGAPVAVLISSCTLLAALTLPLWLALLGAMPP